MHWLTSTATSTRELARRLGRRILTTSIAASAVELAGGAWFLSALHDAWPPLAGLVGGAGLVVLGMGIAGKDVEE